MDAGHKPKWYTNGRDDPTYRRGSIEQVLDHGGILSEKTAVYGERFRSYRSFFRKARGESEPTKWGSVAGLVCDIIGVVGVGFEVYIWTKSAPIDAIPGVPAMTRFGFGVPRRWWRFPYRMSWALILLGFTLQLVGQFQR